MTEPHVGCSKDQIAQAVPDTELDTPANAVVIDAVARFRPDQRGQDVGDMHDVFIVISEGGEGEHVARTVYAADEDDARQTHQDNYADEPPWRFTNKPSRLVTFGGGTS